MLGITNDTEAMNQFSHVLSDTERYSLVCMRKGSKRIIGVNKIQLKYPETGDSDEVIIDMSFFNNKIVYDTVKR